MIYVAVAGFLGGIINGLIGFASSGEAWSFRKFLPTFLRSAAAGAAIAVSYPLIYTLGFWPAIIGGFLVGAGFDDIWHRLAATIKK